MFDFLRALAPVSVPKASRAIAAMPSRFAAARPLNASMPEAETPDASPVRREIVSSLITRVEAEATGPSREIEPPQVHGELPQQRDASADAAGVPPATRRDRPLTVPVPVPAQARDAGHAPPAESIAVSRAVNQPVSARVASAAEREIRRAGAPSDAVTAGPLSAATLASRPAATPEARPVVHVTIDRLEVRAPAASGAQPATSRRPRSSASSVSLGDYLRGSRRHGGAR